MNKTTLPDARLSPTLRAAPMPHGPVTVAAASGGLAERAQMRLGRAVEHLLSLQSPEGYWCAELEGDSILESEYILLKWIIEKEQDPRLPLIANYLRTLQGGDGAWVNTPAPRPTCPRR
jgi:hypothetical protein